MKKISIYPENIPTGERHQYLLTAVAPRPIALVSTIDSAGRVNLSPYSFFNVFSANPPILIFSPARRVRDNTTKHTLQNVMEIPECVVNVVTQEIVHQTSLSSTEYDAGVNEFEKAGFTAVKSERVKPPYVLESKASFECKVIDVKPLGTEAGAGNLVICEVVNMHFSEEALDENNQLATEKLDLVGRMGGPHYVHSNGDALFSIPKPLREQGIGFDQLPKEILLSTVFTGNDLAQLANVAALPKGNYAADPATHRVAKQYIQENKVEAAWRTICS